MVPYLPKEMVDDHTRWAPTNPTSYKWSYKPYKWTYTWVIWVITPISGVINLLITNRGPPCISHPFFWRMPSFENRLGFAKAAQSMLGSSSAAAAAAAAAATAAGMEQEFWVWKWRQASNHQKFKKKVHRIQNIYQFSYNYSHIHRSGVFNFGFMFAWSGHSWIVWGCRRQSMHLRMKGTHF